MSIKFLYPDNAGDFSAIVSASHGSDASIYNLAYNTREALFDSATTANTFTFDYDFTSAVNINYCYLANIANAVSRADIDGSNDSIKLTFYADDNASFTSPESSTVNIQLSDLVGLDIRDYYQALTFTVPYRYYRCKIETTTGDNIRLYLSKLWFGFALDLGVCPNAPVEIEYIPMPIYHEKRITLDYTGVPDSVRTMIYNYLDSDKLIKPVVILDINNQILAGDTLAYCRVVEVDYNTRFEDSQDVKILLTTEY